MSVYLDAAASTPVDPEVLAEMLEVLAGSPMNPGSAHWAGQQAARRLRAAREHVADLTGHGPASVVFTSGATEANNLALRGLLQSATAANERRRGVVTARTEHPSVLATLKSLAAAGVPVAFVDVDREGRVDLGQLAALVDESTLLVSVMAANNETGVLTDLEAVAEIAHAAGAYVHTDASQLLAWGPLPSSVDVDMITVSGHKMHGPQGVGALVATREVRDQLRSLTTGGGQEGGLRSGTVNVAGVVGLGAAAQRATMLGPSAADRVRALRDQLHEALVGRLSPGPGAVGGGPLRRGLPQLNGHPIHRLPGVVNLAFGDDDAPIDAEQILAAAPSVAVSTGSACSAGVPGPSPVLLSMGQSHARAESSIRFSLSRMSEPRELDEAVAAIGAAVDAVTGHTAPPPPATSLSDRPDSVQTRTRPRRPDAPGGRHMTTMTTEGAQA